jgi:NAD(P)H-flavin reductase
MTPVMYRVVARTDELPDTVTLTLEPVDERIGPSLPGQFNMLWAFGIGEAPISIADVGASPLVHTIRRVGAVTNALCDAQLGDLIGVRGPFGVGWDLDRARGADVLVVAGGLGVAPVRPIVQHILEHRDDYGRLVLLVGARSPDALLYREELEHWRGRLDIEVEVTVDTAPPTWRGDVGLVTDLIRRAPVEMSTATVFVCGPEVMMRFVAQTVIDAGADPGEVYVSLERNMECAVGHCGHCQLGPAFICKDGPVLAWESISPQLAVRAR